MTSDRRIGACGVQLNRAGVIAVVLACLPAQLAVVHAAGCPERPACQGYGCKGGPGYRSNATGKCVGMKATEKQCGDPPTLRCTFENAPGTGLNRGSALGKTSGWPG